MRGEVSFDRIGVKCFAEAPSKLFNETPVTVDACHLAYEIVIEYQSSYLKKAEEVGADEVEAVIEKNKYLWSVEIGCVWEGRVDFDRDDLNL